MDWGQIAGSVVVAIVVAWITASIRVGQSRRAERNDDAIVSIARGLEPYRRRVVWHQRGWGQHFSSEPVRTEDDFRAVQLIATNLPDLVWWRARLVERRTRRTFGDRYFELVDVQPEDATLTDIMGLIEVDAHLSGGRADPSPSMTWMTQLPAGDLTNNFRKEIERLQAAW